MGSNFGGKPVQRVGGVHRLDRVRSRDEMFAELLDLYDNRCYWCGSKIGHGHPLAATEDHLTPLSRGGSDNWENIVPACEPCNQRKNRRTAEEYRDYLARIGAPEFAQLSHYHYFLNLLNRFGTHRSIEAELLRSLIRERIQVGFLPSTRPQSIAFLESNIDRLGAKVEGLSDEAFDALKKQIADLAASKRMSPESKSVSPLTWRRAAGGRP